MADATTIRRPQTQEEKEDYVDIWNRYAQTESVFSAILREKYKKHIQVQMKKKFEERLPFPEASMKEAFNKSVKMAELDKVGFIGNHSLPNTALENLKKTALKAFKYEDYLKADNFEKIDEGESLSDDLSKRAGRNVYVRKIKYQFKSDRRKYIIMEDGEEAKARALK